MIRILVSSCLLGERVRYHGGHARSDDSRLRRWVEDGRVVPFCPEVDGGLPTPRPPAEIRGGDGEAVLRGAAEVVTADGARVTEAFLKGAERALEAARAHGVGLAILTEASPSCGSGRIHDGTFSGRTRAGRGVTSALLERHGIRVFAADELDAAAACLERLESARRGSSPAEVG